MFPREEDVVDKIEDKTYQKGHNLCELSWKTLLPGPTNMSELKLSDDIKHFDGQSKKEHGILT